MLDSSIRWPSRLQHASYSGPTVGESLTARAQEFERGSIILRHEMDDNLRSFIFALVSWGHQQSLRAVIAYLALNKGFSGVQRTDLWSRAKITNP